MWTTNFLHLAERVFFRLCVVLFFVVFTVESIAQDFEKLPYFEGFEDTTTYSTWTLNAGPNGQMATNKWCISDADVFVGEKSLYISADEGKTANYENKAIYNVAYREIALDKGEYDLSITWRCEGETDADGLYVCWVSPNWNLNSSVTLPSFTKNSKLTFDVGGDFLNGRKEWTTSTAKITQNSTSKYRLVFVWANNATTANAPSVVIDNIQIAKSELQGCGKPSNVKVSVLTNDVSVSWTGGALGYELMYRKSTETDVTVVKNINQASYVLKGMSEGIYDIFVRSCCPGDTSIWVIKNNVLVYDAAAHCIDFINWDREGTECRTGKHTLGGRFDGDKFIANVESTERGAKDYGYASIASRHTWHYMPGEKDPRTGNELPTVPEGEVVSVRLGNWNSGAEFESVTYTHQLDSGSNMILLLKYAIVIEDPGHPRAEQPVFMLELLDEYNNPLDPSGCGDANFVANTQELINNPDADGTWHIINSKIPILWKEWTTVGINMSQYAKNGPLKYKIRLTTFDCAQSGHFGYAYYTLSCASATIEGLSCGENAGANINAPEGFNYRWYRVRDEKTVCTTRNLQGIEKNDTALYRCKVMFAQDSTCYFDLDASLLPKLPKAQFTPRWTPRNCNENSIRFQNTSHVTTARGATGEKCETHRWYLKEDGDWKLIYEGDSLEYRFPNGGGDFDVMLQTGISNDECIDDTIITVNVPRLGAVVDTIYDTICEGRSLKIEGRRYMQEGFYRVFRGLTFGGCDSTVYLDLKVIPKERDTISAYICKGEEYIFNGQVYTKTGRPRTKYESSCGCDSIVLLNLTVATSIIDEELVLCSGDDFVFDYSVSDAEFTEYEILMSDAAKSVGLKDIAKRPLPEGGKIVLKIADITDKRDSINPIHPGNYDINVVFYYTTDSGVVQSCEHTVALKVLYSVGTIEQKFDNVITLLDADYNGGYEFDYIQWYRNGEPIEGANDTYIYLEEEEINSTDIYSVGLIRKGESEEIMSCGLRLRVGTAVEDVEAIGVDVASNRVKVGESVIVVFEEGYAECVARWWSVTGVKLGEEVVKEEGYLKCTPQLQGIYLLELEMGGERVVRKIVISN